MTLAPPMEDLELALVTGEYLPPLCESAQCKEDGLAEHPAHFYAVFPCCGSRPRVCAHRVAEYKTYALLYCKCNEVVPPEMVEVYPI